MPEMIARDRIQPNDWNVNAFDPDLYPKLVESIRGKGILEPLKVMPRPRRSGHFLLVDGYHRWKAAGELDIDQVPCEVWQIRVEEAKVRGLQLNYLRGQAVPRRLAHLVHDLNATYTTSDLARMLPWSEAQLADSLELLKLPADLTDSLDRQVSEAAEQAPVPVTIVLVGGEHQAFERAMAAAKEHLGRGARRGQHLAEICVSYLESLGLHDFDAAPEEVAVGTSEGVAG